jgi:BlaI family penicillinase repressor
MTHRCSVTDAELEIIKVLWKTGPLTSTAIFAALPKVEERNVGTLKTLLTRLVNKGAVKYEEINQRQYLYTAVITEEEYIKVNRKRMIDLVFDGNPLKLLMNFVKEEKIGRDELEDLIREIEGE